jgi:hypothetical protein
MKKIIIFLIFLGWMTSSSGQSYNTALGMRLGTDWGISLRQRVYKNYSAEFLLQSSLQREEFAVTVLGLAHKPILTRRFNIYYGLGGHRGWVPTGTDGTKPYDDPYGIDFMLGLEATLFGLNVSYDFKPALNIHGGQQFFYSQTGISVRYVFWKRDKYPWEQNQRRRRGLFGGRR